MPCSWKTYIVVPWHHKTEPKATKATPQIYPAVHPSHPPTNLYLEANEGRTHVCRAEPSSDWPQALTEFSMPESIPVTREQPWKKWYKPDPKATPVIRHNVGTYEDSRNGHAPNDLPVVVYKVWAWLDFFGEYSPCLKGPYLDKGWDLVKMKLTAMWSRYKMRNGSLYKCNGAIMQLLFSLSLTMYWSCSFFS